MYRSLATAFLCFLAYSAQATQPLQCAVPAAAADAVRQEAVVVRTAAMLPGDGAIVRAPVRSAPVPEDRSGTMVFAALALMVGIAIRRHGLGKQ